VRKEQDKDYSRALIFLNRSIRPDVSPTSLEKHTHRILEGPRAASSHITKHRQPTMNFKEEKKRGRKSPAANSCTAGLVFPILQLASNFKQAKTKGDQCMFRRELNERSQRKKRATRTSCMPHHLRQRQPMGRTDPRAEVWHRKREKNGPALIYGGMSSCPAWITNKTE